MGDERLRALERRWQETNTAEDWAAFLREQVRTGTPLVADVRSFLQAATRFTASLREARFRAITLAQVAWAYCELEDPDGARALLGKVRDAVSASPEGDPWAMRALAWLGAVRASLNEPDRGEAEVATSLPPLLTALGDGTFQTQRTVDARKALVGWLSAQACRNPGVDDPLLASSWKRIRSRGSILSLVVEEALPAIVKLGLRPNAHAALWDLLQPAGLDRQRQAAQGYQYPQEAIKVGVHSAMVSLMRLANEESATRDAQHVIRLVGDLPEGFDEFVNEPLQAALGRLEPDHARSEISRLLAKINDPYQRVLVLNPVIAWEPDAERRREQFSIALSLSEQLEHGGNERRRATVRLIHHLPRVEPDEERILERLNELRSGRPGSFDRSEYLYAEAECLRHLSEPTASQELAKLAARASGEILEGEGEPNWHEVQVVEACLRNIADPSELVESIRSLVTEAAERSVQQEGQDPLGLSFFVRLWSRLAVEELKRGERSRFDSDRAAVNRWHEHLTEIDAQEICETIAEECTSLPPADRPEVCRWALELAESLVKERAAGYFIHDLFARLCSEAVRLQA